MNQIDKSNIFESYRSINYPSFKNIHSNITPKKRKNVYNGVHSSNKLDQNSIDCIGRKVITDPFPLEGWNVEENSRF